MIEAIVTETFRALLKLWELPSNEFVWDQDYIGTCHIELKVDTVTSVQYISVVGQISTLPSELFSDDKLLFGCTKVLDNDNELSAVEGLSLASLADIVDAAVALGLEVVSDSLPAVEAAAADKV